jgi:hypothetical protein
MSRSYKKPFEWISKRSYPEDRRAHRHNIKQRCHEAEIDFDPDKDFEELYESQKAQGDWGTRCGFEMPPDDADDTWMHEEYIRIQRK